MTSNKSKDRKGLRPQEQWRVPNKLCKPLLEDRITRRRENAWSNGRKYLGMQLYYEEENSKTEGLQKMQELDQSQHET